MGSQVERLPVKMATYTGGKNNDKHYVYSITFKKMKKQNLKHLSKH